MDIAVSILNPVLLGVRNTKEYVFKTLNVGWTLILI
jgi:hypothetical protein